MRWRGKRESRVTLQECPEGGKSARGERARQYKAGVKPFDLATQTAYHEAGHVVFSALHGPGVEIVTIDPQRVEPQGSPKSGQ